MSEHRSDINTLRADPNGLGWTYWVSDQREVELFPSSFQEIEEVDRGAFDLKYDYNPNNAQGLTRNQRVALELEKDLEGRMKRLLKFRNDKYYDNREKHHALRNGEMEGLLAEVDEVVNSIALNTERFKKMDAEGYHSSDNEELEFEVD